MVYLSQVFFDSGYVVENLDANRGRRPVQNRLFVVDGYHGFMALPTDLGGLSRAGLLSRGWLQVRHGR